MDGTLGAGYYSDGWGPLPFVFAPVPSRKVKWSTVSGKAGRGRLRERPWAFGALGVVIALLLHASLFTGRGLVPADGVLVAPPWVEVTSQPTA